MDNFDRCFTTVRVALPKHRQVKEKECYLKTKSGYCSNAGCENCGKRCQGWSKCSDWTSYEGYVRRKKAERKAKEAV